MNTGYYSFAAVALVPLPSKVWTPVHTIDSLPEGPTILNVQLYGRLPAVRPKDIMIRWVRRPELPNPDRTARHPVVVGTLTDWSCDHGGPLEFIDPLVDLPFRLEMYHNAVSSWSLSTVIVKALNPGEYIAQRIKAALE